MGPWRRLVCAGLLLAAAGAGKSWSEEVVVIPQGRDVSIDGTAAAGEWEDAREVKVEGGGLAAAFLVKHDGRVLNLALLIDDNPAGRRPLFLDLSIDPRRGGQGQGDDHWFRVDQALCHSQGGFEKKRNCLEGKGDWKAAPLFPRGEPKTGFRCWEISIPLALAGIVPDREFGVHLALDLGQAGHAGYPAAGRREIPGSWGVFLIPAGEADAEAFSAEKAAIAKAVEDSIGWARNKNRDLLFGLFAHDSRLLILQPTSEGTISGFAALQKFCADTWLDPAYQAAGHEIRDLKIDLSPQGDTAWFSAELDDCASYQGREECRRNIRWTGVLVKKEGRWVFTQQHSSFALDKAMEQARGGTEAEAEAVRKTVREYALGWQQGDLERVDWVIDSRFLRLFPAAAGEGLDQENREGFLLRVGKTAAPEGVPAAAGEPRLRVLGLEGLTAAARVDFPAFGELLTLSKVGGRWRILTALAGEAPPAPGAGS